MASPSVVAKRVIKITVGKRYLEGILTVPSEAVGIVLFAHGSGSGRLSPRNQFVAGVLHQGSLATLLIDLLDETEANDHEKVFNIPLLADRLRAAGDFLQQDPATQSLRLGLFGASTGAAAALQMAGEHQQRIAAVVSRGGRPDLAKAILPAVQAPTLLIVGSHDPVVLELNKLALDLLTCPKQLTVVAGASHLFAEAGTLEEAARLAQEWFVRYLKK